VSTLPGRTRTAVLVVDLQHDVVGPCVRRDEVVAATAVLADRARAEGTPVVWVQHRSDGIVEGSDGWRLVLEPAPDEPVVHKRYRDSFEGTDLEDVLARLGVGRLVVAGTQTDFCVRSTIHGGLARGYDVWLVSDAHTTEDLTEWGAPPPEQVVAHTNLYWSDQKAPGRTAGVAMAAEVALA
jgi:nicotinamidase-related amidase